MRWHVLATVLMMVLAGGVWGGWLWSAESKLSAAQAEVAAMGFAVTPAQADDKFGLPTLPDADNAGVQFKLMKPIAGAGVDTYRSSSYEAPTGYAYHHPYWPQWHAVNARAAADPRVQNALATLRSLRERNARAASGQTLEDFFLNWNTPFNESRWLANTACDLAALLLERGEFAEGLRYLQDAAYIPSVVLDYPGLVATLVAIGEEALWLSEATRSTPLLTPKVLADPAVRAEVEALLFMLIDPEANEARTAALSRALEHEIAAGDLFLRRELAQVGPSAVAVGIDEVPQHYRGNAAIIRWIESGFDPAVEPDLPDTPGDQFDRSAKSPTEAFHHSHSYPLYLSRIPESIKTIEFYRRAAAIGLATALFRADHKERWPDGVEELVPRYLSAAPIDPFSPNRAAIELRMLAWPGGSPRPVLIGVGLDGEADVSSKWIAGEVSTVWPNGRPEEAVFDSLKHTEGNERNESSFNSTTDDVVRDLTFPPAELQAQSRIEERTKAGLDPDSDQDYEDDWE